MIIFLCVKMYQDSCARLKKTKKKFKKTFYCNVTDEEKIESEKMLACDIKISQTLKITG